MEAGDHAFFVLLTTSLHLFTASEKQLFISPELTPAEKIGSFSLKFLKEGFQVFKPLE